MPAITFTSNGPKALDLHNATLSFSGDEAQVAARSKVRKKILSTWPELEETGATPEEEASRVQRLQADSRSFEISTTEQTALAEGALGVLKDRSIKDIQKDVILDLAKLCRFSRWLEGQIGKAQIREFTESDEAVEVDPEPAAAA
jgi:hypothetical protein